MEDCFRSLLTWRHVARRLKWTRAYRHWTVDDWHKVIYSDECAVQKDSDPCSMWVSGHRSKRKNT